MYLHRRRQILPILILFLQNMFTYFACNFLILYIVICKQLCYNKTIINKGVIRMIEQQIIKLLELANKNTNQVRVAEGSTIMQRKQVGAK